MIGYLLAHRYENFDLRYVPMNFSAQMDKMGKPSARKVLHLFRVILNLWLVTAKLRLRGIRPVLYFPPAGPHLTPVLRDLVLLGLTRPFFSRSIFHFHAAGLGEFRNRLPKILRPLFDWAYHQPDVTVATAASGLNDGDILGGKINRVVYNGISPLPAHLSRSRPAQPEVVRLLFVGLLLEDKGIFVLLEALRILKASDLKFEAHLVGRFQSAVLEDRALTFLRNADLTQQVSFQGELHGDPLFQAYADADIFCFPSFYAAESFGLVCVEAMRASLPVVATRWRGIPEVVEHGRTGLIVPPRQPQPLAAALARLINDPSLRAEFGRRGRERYLAHFTVERFCTEMGNIFSVATALQSREQDPSQPAPVQDVQFEETLKSKLMRTAK